MPNTWKSDYLLNLIMVARVDNVIKPVEILYMSRVRDNINGSNLTLADSVMRSYFDGVKTIGSLIGNEKCLRDMVVMAVIDGSTDRKEQECIEAFIDVAKIPRDRVADIIRDALICVGKEKEIIINSIEGKYLNRA